MDKIKTIKFEGSLYRADPSNTYIADPSNTQKRPRATNNYRINGINANIKYFTLKHNETKAYSKRGSPWIKEWKTNEGVKLKLVDILNLETRKALESLFTTNIKKSLNSSFPINGNQVFRVSEANATRHDYNVLRAICNLGFDGYFMNEVRGFHSEVGLCKSGISKLYLKSSIQNEVPPPLPKRINKKSFFSPNQPGSTRKRPSFFSPIQPGSTRKRPLFSFNNTTRNNKTPTSVKRLKFNITSPPN